MPRTLRGILGVLALGAGLHAPARAADTAEPPKVDMTTFQFVMLRPGPREKAGDEREVQARQEAHLRFLERLHRDGRAVASGPVERAGDLLAVLVLAVPTADEASAIVREDPWVAAGRYTFEVHPWYSAKGAFRPAKDVVHLARAYLVLLKRPPNAPAYPDAKLAEIQEGHMANIRAMAASGDLVAAGPFAEDGPIRGIFVFRTPDEARVRALIAEDPAVKAGRLVGDVYAWSVPESVLP